MKTIVSMNKQGRLTVPAAARQALQIEGPAEFEVEIGENALILRPAIVIPREDAWAYAPEHLQRIQKARQELREGRTRRLTETELDQMPSDRS